MTTPKKLRKSRRYAYLGIVVLAAFLPTIDPVTLILESIPLILLFEGSILLSAALIKPEAPSTELAGAESG